MTEDNDIVSLKAELAEQLNLFADDKPLSTAAAKKVREAIEALEEASKVNPYSMQHIEDRIRGAIKGYESRKLARLSDGDPERATWELACFNTGKYRRVADVLKQIQADRKAFFEAEELYIKERMEWADRMSDEFAVQATQMRSVLTVKEYLKPLKRDADGPEGIKPLTLDADGNLVTRGDKQ